MNKKNLFAFVLILTLFLVSLVSATGYCQTDKSFYHKGETGTFYCYCSQNNERFQSGYIVWQLDNGTILQSDLVNSGNCRNYYFGTSYTFSDDFNASEGIHNTTFSANADGSGTPTNWGNAGDINSALWNFTNISTTDCIITNIRAKEYINLGEVGSVEFEVKDGITNKSLIFASCVAEGHDISGAPLIRVPEEKESFLKTSDEGTIAFIHNMQENFWETNATYLFEFHCHSLPNVSNSYNTNQVAFLSNGSVAGMKSCTFVSLFKTGSKDNRGAENLTTGRSLIMIAIILMFLGFIAGSIYGLTKRIKVEWKVGLLSVIYLSLFTITFLLYQVTSISFSFFPLISSILYIFWLTLAVGFFPFVIIIGLYLVVNAMNQKNLETFMGMGYSSSEAQTLARK